MTTSAIYKLKTGFISSTVTSATGIADVNQIASLNSQGSGVVTIPDGKTGGTGMIDLSTVAYVDFAPATPVPNIYVQLAAALIKANLIPQADFHPTTISDMNTALTAANMAAIPTS